MLGVSTGEPKRSCFTRSANARFIFSDRFDLCRLLYQMCVELEPQGIRSVSSNKLFKQDTLIGCRSADESLRGTAILCSQTIVSSEIIPRNSPPLTQLDSSPASKSGLHARKIVDRRDHKMCTKSHKSCSKTNTHSNLNRICRKS